MGPKKGAKSRFEINKIVRGVFNRYQTDMMELQVSCYGSSLQLSGTLQKDTKQDFTFSEVESLSREILAIPEIRDISSNLSNWTIIPGNISKKDSKDKKDAVKKAMSKAAR